MNHGKADRGTPKGGAQILQNGFAAMGLRVAVALVLCCGLMIPTTLTNTRAYAEEAVAAASDAEGPQATVEGEQTESDVLGGDVVAEEEGTGSNDTDSTVDAADPDEPAETVAPASEEPAGEAGVGDEPAIMAASADVVCEVDGYSVSARHTGTTDNDARQFVEFVINPGYGSVTVTDADALARSFTIVNSDGSPNSKYTSVTAAVSDDGDSIVVTGELGFALVDGVAHVKTTSSDGLIAGCTAETYVRGSGYVQAPVKFDGIDTVVPSGLNFTAVSQTAGTDTVPASTTFMLTSKANVRSMNHVIWMSDGTSIIPSNGAETNAGYSQTTVAHQHAYLTMSEKDAVASIVSNAYDEEGARTLAQYGYSIKDNGNATFTVTADSPKAGEVIDASIYDDNFLQANGLDMDTPLDDKTSVPSGPATITTTELRGRASSDPSTSSLALKNVGEGWAKAAKTMKVAWLKDGKPTDEQTLTDEQWTLSGNAIKVTRTEEAPVFETTKDDATKDDPYVQERQYRVTIEAEGFPTVTKDIRFYTNYNSGTLEVRMKNGSEESSVAKTVNFTEEEVNDMLTFQNGSSSCGHTGVRTFSGWGVPITTLLEKSGITFEPGDTLKMRCTDGDGTDKYYWRGGEWTYEELLGNQRYFLSSLYEDKDVQAKFIEAAQNAAEAPENTAFRQAAAAAENTPMTPMISTGYVETMLDSDSIVNATLPTEDNTTVSKLVGKENNFRFIYGITMTQDKHTVSFDAGNGSALTSQTVNGPLMTSTPEQENTTMSSCYWVIGFDIIKGSHTPEAEDTTPDTVTKPADPTRDGYTFAGWYTDEALTQSFDFGSQVDSDMTLYAKWIENGSGENPNPQPEQPATGTKTDAGTGVAASGTVLAADGSAHDANLAVSEYPATSERFQELKKQYAPANNLLFKVFDVELQDANGAVITDLGADGLTISFPVGTQYNGKPGAIVHLHKNADGTVTEQRTSSDLKVVDGMLTITGVKNFSEFVVMVNDTATQTSAATAATPKTLTKTGDGTPIIPIACFAGAGLALAGICLLMSRKKTHRR